MKVWSHVNGGFRATQDAWSQTAYQLRGYAYTRYAAGVAEPKRQVQALEDVTPTDASTGALVVPAPESQPPGGQA